MPSINAFIDDHMMPGAGIDIDNPRSVYALTKLYAERNLSDRIRFLKPNELDAAIIIRPFNVFGPGQKRGVVYSMIKSALKDKVIKYADDTTRTFTSLSYISNSTVKLLDRIGFKTINMSDGFSTNMETMAKAINLFLVWKFKLQNSIKLEKLLPDKSIRYRQASTVIYDEV
jgi:nucleoside-diphosphate-sugar epimerase